MNFDDDVMKSNDDEVCSRTTMANVVEQGRRGSRAVARGASQKPYSPSPGAGSRRRRVPETCSPDRRCTSALGMEEATVAAQQKAKANPEMR
jgi:hypothetical protein